MDNGTRSELLTHLAQVVGSVTTAYPTRVAVDGPPAAGKTTLADELAVVLRAQGREVIRASIDDFLLPRALRYRRGKYSAEACYHDSFDFDALYRVLLDPLGPGGDRRFQQAFRDRLTDASLSQPITTTAPANAVLLFDGVFLMRPELIGRWDVRIFVSAAFEETLDRSRTRDQAYRSVAETERLFHNRYHPSQQFYFTTARPTDHADVIVHNDEPQQPAWEVRPR